MTAPYREIQSLDPGAILELFVLDCGPLGGSVYRFHPGTNELGTSVIWQGQTYQPFPVAVEGLEWTGKGSLPRPSITVANVDGTLGGLVRTYEDLVGAKVTVKRCLAKHLDAANFPGGVNLTADPTACWPDESYEIEQKTSETAEAITFQLASAMDVQGLMLPARPIQATVCAWKNSQSDICPYVTTCDRLLATCKVNFGATNPLPFGGEPACNRVR